MKKSLVTLAILAAAGVASAQSSVTLYGNVAAVYTHGSGSGVGATSTSQIGSDCGASSFLGFRGKEDLGGGMSVGFVLEGDVCTDSGSGNPWPGLSSTNNQAGGAIGGSALSFNRQSMLSLSSGMGELRVGRDYTAQFLNHAVFDPYGTAGMGTTQTLKSIVFIPTAIRASNSIGYILPGNLGGFYGQFQHYLGENVRNGAATQNDGTGTGIRLGYANGPINVAFATARTRYAQAFNPGGLYGLVTFGNVTSTNMGASYDLGVAKVMALLSRDRINAAPSAWTVNGSLIGVHVPMGAGLIRASYSISKSDVVVSTPKTAQLALGYVHNMSKRTNLYATYARASNSGGAATGLNGATTAPNSGSTGYEFGMIHSF